VLARQRHFAPHLVVAGSAVGAHLQLARGDLASAMRWVEESNLSTGDMDLSYLNERAYLTLARVRIAQGRADVVGHGNGGKSPFLQESLDLLARHAPTRCAILAATAPPTSGSKSRADAFLTCFSGREIAKDLQIAKRNWLQLGANLAHTFMSGMMCWMFLEMISMTMSMR
jgi:hypothetical protein